MDKALSEKIEKTLNATELLVIDFSAIVNSDYVNFDEFMKLAVSKNIKTVVSAEFYENYDVVSNSSNEEQKNIIKKAYTYLRMLDEKELLMNLPDVYDSRDLSFRLASVKNICYLFFRVSEMAEALNEQKSEFSSIVVDYDKTLKIFVSPEEMRSALSESVDEELSGKDYFGIETLPEEGSVLHMSDNTENRLKKFIAGGGEGAVYDCSYGQNYLTKIYHNGQLTLLRVKKMLHMENKQIRYTGLCWPEKVVYTEKGEPAGFVMKKVDGKSLSVVFDSYESVHEMFPSWKKRDLIRLCIKVFTRIQYLHLFGILIGDVRMNNVMVDKNGEPSLVDLDSCQLDNLPCPGGFGEFTPPELQNREFSKTLRSYYNESFSCAVMMFKILFCGLHPYDRIGGADRIEDDIAGRNFPFTLDTNDDFASILFKDYYSEIWKHTPYQFQQFLVDIFKDGKRPNIQTMLMMLKTYDKFIEQNENRYSGINEILFQ